MTAKDKIRTTIELMPGDKEKLAQVAAELGIIRKTGPGIGEGSISGLMQQIASGHLEVTHYLPPRPKQ